MPSQRFQIVQPLETHFREAACDEVECANHREGWVTVLDPGNPAHAGLFRALKASGRHYTEMRSEDAGQLLGRDLPVGLQAFVFPPGQQCFETHHVPVEREPFFIHHPARGGSRRHANGRNFNEHFNEQAYRAGRLISG